MHEIASRRTFIKSVMAPGVGAALAVSAAQPAIAATPTDASVEMTFATRRDAENAVIRGEIKAIRTLGYHEPGVGGGVYVDAGTSVPRHSPRGRNNVDRPASHFIAAGNGAAKRYFVLAEPTPNVFQFGAIADGTSDGKSSRGGGAAFDNTEAFNDALSYGASVFVPRGRFWIAGTLHITEDGTVLHGVGAGGNNDGGTELYFGPGDADCIQAGDGVNQLRWCKITRLFIDAKARTGGNTIFAFFNYQLVLEELRIVHPYNGIRLFRGIGFMLRDIVMSYIRAGDGTPDGPREIGYGIKFSGAPELYDLDTGKKVKRDTHVVFLENISFGSAKHETDPTNWTVGLWCAENAASVNGATLKNQNVRHAILITRAATVDPNDQLLVPPGYRLVPGTRTDASGRTHEYGSKEYPAEKGTVPELNGRYQDLTLFYVGGDFLGGEYVYNDESAGVAIYNPHFFRSFQGNSVYMGPKAKDMSIYGGQVIGPYKHGFDMHGHKWHVSGVSIFKPSLDSDREKHKGKFSCVHVGPTSVGGDVVNCKIGNEPDGTAGRAGDTAKFGLDVEPGARSTWYHGNRFHGCITGDVNNRAGRETRAGNNWLQRD